MAFYDFLDVRILRTSQKNLHFFIYHVAQYLTLLSGKDLTKRKLLKTVRFRDFIRANPEQLNEMLSKKQSFVKYSGQIKNRMRKFALKFEIRPHFWRFQEKI